MSHYAYRLRRARPTIAQCDADVVAAEADLAWALNAAPDPARIAVLKQALCAARSAQDRARAYDSELAA